MLPLLVPLFLQVRSSNNSVQELDTETIDKCYLKICATNGSFSTYLSFIWQWTGPSQNNQVNINPQVRMSSPGDSSLCQVMKSNQCRWPVFEGKSYYFALT